MSRLTLTTQPDPPVLEPCSEPQLCYLLVSVGAQGGGGPRPVNWALVADASRSMRIPIVDEQQFRELVRSGGAHETLVDGVPVWQLSGPVPADVRAAAPSALDHVRRALHTVVERLGGDDRFALVACAESAVLLAGSRPGDDRGDLARAIGRLGQVDLGEATDLASGIAMGLDELRIGSDARRAGRLLLLTDGFTQRLQECIALAESAAAAGVAISTIGLGGEFQEDLLTTLADRSGGRALFLNTPHEIPRAVAAELDAARAVAVRAVRLTIAPAAGVVLRRVTRIRSALATLAAPVPSPGAPIDIALGDLPERGATRLLLELVAPAATGGMLPLAQITIAAEEGAAYAAVTAEIRHGAPPLAQPVLDAAGAASALRLQQRALAAAASGNAEEAARLLANAAARFDELGEPQLARAAREQAAALRRTGRLAALATKELTYATRRLGE
jgi:hypothetical protein